MSFNLDQVNKILKVYRSLEFKLSDALEEEKAVRCSIRQVMGRDFSLDELVEMVTVQECREDIDKARKTKKHTPLGSTPYSEAFFSIWRILQSEENINNMIKGGFLEEGKDKETMQYNISKIILKIGEEGPNTNYETRRDLLLLLEDLYKISGRPKTEEEKAKLIADFPMIHFRLGESARKLLYGELLYIALRIDKEGEDSVFKNVYHDIGRHIPRIRKQTKTYSSVVDSLNSIGRLSQRKIASLGGLPLDAAFYRSMFYAIVVDAESKAKIVSYSMPDLSPLGEKTLDDLTYPFSMAGCGDNLILVNDGKIDLIPSDLNVIDIKSNEGGNLSMLKKSPVELLKSLMAKENKGLKKYKDLKRWKIVSVKADGERLSLIFYNYTNGDYILSVLDKGGKIKTTSGKSYITADSSVEPNYCSYGSYHISLFIEGESHPPSVAMLDHGLVLTEGESIKIFDYNLKMVREYKTGIKEFQSLDSAFPLSVVAGAGNKFGLYACFEQNTQTPLMHPLFLMFSLDKDYAVSFIGALKTEEIPINIATGAALSKDGYLAISSSGGRVYASANNHDIDPKWVRTISPGCLEIFKLDEIMCNKALPQPRLDK